MMRSGSEGGASSRGDLAGLAELDVVRSAVLLESSGRVRERAGPGDRDGLRRAATLAAAMHATAGHLGAVTGTGTVSQIVIPVEGRSILLVPVPTRGVSLLLLLVCETEHDDELRASLDAFLERMTEERPAEGAGGGAGDLEAALLEGLDRLFPQTDDPVD